MGALGPVSEGLFAWIVGIGACVGSAIWIGAHSTRSTKKKGAQRVSDVATTRPRLQRSAADVEIADPDRRPRPA